MDNSPLFIGIASQTRAALDRVAQRKDFAANENLFVQGDVPRALFVLLSGRVKVWRTTEDGTAVSLFFREVGDPFGTLAVSLDRPNAVSATALEPSRAIFWRIEDLRRIMADDPRLATNLLHIVTGHTERFVERLAEISAVPVEQRLARTLLRLGGQINGRPKTDELTVSRQELAELTSTTLPTVSRIISRWRAAHVVDGRRRGTVRLLDIARLFDLAGLPEAQD